MLGNMHLYDVFLTVESIKNFLNLPWHYFDLESKRTYLTRLAGHGCPLLHALSDCIPAAGERDLLEPESTHGNQQPHEAVKEIIQQKDVRSLSAPSRGTFHQGRAGASRRMRFQTRAWPVEGE